MHELAVISAIIAVLVFINGLYVAAEFAIIAVRPSRLANLAEEGHPLAPGLLGIVRSTRHLDTYISTAQAGITMASLGLAMYGEESLAELLALRLPGTLDDHTAHLVAGFIAILILTYVHIVPGEMIPKSLALSRSEATAFAVALPMRVSQIVFAPVVVPLTWLGGAVLRLLRVPNPATRERVLSADELGEVISQSTEGGLLTESEGEMLLNIFDFSDRQAHHVMTPKKAIDALDLDLAGDALTARLAASPHHRFPVCDGDIDHVAGILHLKDYVRWRLENDGDPDLRSLVRPALVVPMDMSLERLLELFRRERGHLALVLDKGHRTVGLVTLHDLAEEIVGALPQD